MLRLAPLLWLVASFGSATQPKLHAIERGLLNLPIQINLNILNNYSFANVECGSGEECSNNHTKKIGNAFNTQYYVSICIGGQFFNVLLDTASADLWVPSVKCKQSVCLKRNRYDSTKSHCYKPDGTKFHMQYAPILGDSVLLDGFLSTDTVVLADTTVQSLTFAEITSMPAKIFNVTNFDGILGLGFRKISISNAKPLFDELIEQQLIKQPIFSFYLNRNGTDEHNGGMLVLGGSSPRLYSGSLTYVPLSKVGYWQFTTSSIKVKHEHVCKNCETIIDVGTSLIIAPPDALAAINAQLGLSIKNRHQGVYILNCAKVENLPNITFHIADHNFVMSPADYVFQFGAICVSGFTSLIDAGEGVTLDPSTVDIDYYNLWILGNLFLGTFHVEFDVGNKRVGIARNV